MKKTVGIVLLCCICIVQAGGSFAARPSQAAIASAHPLATQAGFEILSKGGNAYDAAVAVTSTLAVVEPYASGLGGGGFYLLYRAGDKKTVMLDARETAPGKATRNLYLDTKGNIIKGASLTGPLSAGIPGIPAALVHLAKKYGKLPLSVSLAPAIRIARSGFPVDKAYIKYAGLRLTQLMDHEEAAGIFLVNDEVPPEGYVLKQPDLATTLEKLAKLGRKGFYQGDVASKMVSAVQAAGGIWTRDDLKNYRVIERNPIRFTYKGYTITSASPPSSGGIVLAEMLNILNGYKLDGMDKVSRIHVIIESMRRAYHDRAIYLGDPDFVKIPVKMLTSMKYAKSLRSTIQANRATPSKTLSSVMPSHGKGQDTTHFSILDKDGNRVAATLSINYPFGSCFVAPGTGVVLNDEMDDFSAKPGVANAYGLVGADANAIEPGKRPLSSMSPTFIEGKNRIAIVGTPGGSRIITMVLLAILNFTDGANAQQIVDAYRFHHQYLPDKIFYEKGAFTTREKTQLEKMGYHLHELSSPYGEQVSSYGNMQVVIWDKRHNKASAYSDRRGVGAAFVR